MKPIYSVVIIATILLLITVVSAQIFKSHSQVPVVTAAEIQTLQADSSQFLLVDVRDEAESDVSIIPGAITLAEFEQTKQTHQGKKIITYCTIGYRSGIYAQKLRQMGWDAFNYKGSILDWCSNHLPVVTPGGEITRRVHTYSPRYALASGYQPVY